MGGSHLIFIEVNRELTEENGLRLSTKPHAWEKSTAKAPKDAGLRRLRHAGPMFNVQDTVYHSCNARGGYKNRRIITCNPKFTKCKDIVC